MLGPRNWSLLEKLSISYSINTRQKSCGTASVRKLTGIHPWLPSSERRGPPAEKHISLPVNTISKYNSVNTEIMI